MEVKHFESLYPADSRFSEIEKILGFIKNGNSCQLISFPGTGRANILNLLAYNRIVREKHLGENQKYIHFVYMDFSEVKNRSLLDVYKFIFLSLTDSLLDRGLTEDHNKLHEIFKEHTQFNDELVFFQGIKEAISYLALEKKLTVVFLFDKFENYLPKLTDEFFSGLRILRNKAKYRFSSIFSLDRPLEDSLDPLQFDQFYEFLAGNDVFVDLYDIPGIDFRRLYFEKKFKKELPNNVYKNIIELTAGHARLTRIALETVFNEKESIKDKNELEKLLFEQKNLINALLIIWNYLSPKEKKILGKEKDEFLEKIGLTKNEKISISLLDKYVREMAVFQTVKIELDENTGAIKKGEMILSDKLTSSEYKLLKYLLQNQEKIIEREEIIKNVWRDTASVAGVTDQAMDQLILRLRKKIEENPNNPTFLITVKGRGFKFSE
jgi:DNA-binding winged helix-turn-helix (wHTH) protein